MEILELFTSSWGSNSGDAYFPNRSLILERQLHLDSFKDTPIPTLFVKLDWIPLEGFTRIACAHIVRLFYLNIIEHDWDESYLKSSLFEIVAKVTLEMIFVRRGCIILSQILHREPINLATCIIDEMILRGDPSMSKKEVISCGILIVEIYQRVGVEFLVNLSFLKQMGLINTLLKQRID
uniref:Uncharacterized protein n=1 Tax=Vitis vinifera TaxID=29760 RepID=A5AK51_VITVI|nr:hypothetical protein VITISV_031031 [Vitis vinifera]